MTARALYGEALPLLLSRRAAAHLLGIDRSGAPFAELIRSGRLGLVPAGSAQRIPLEDVQRVAREGFTFSGKPARLRTSTRRAAPARGVGDSIRALEVEP